MTVLSAQTIRQMCVSPLLMVANCPPLISPFFERTRFEGVSFGLSSAGYDVRIAEDVMLRPGAFVLASTMEKFDIPDNLIGIVHDKSSFARRGVCVQNTVLESGWRGFLTLELTNHIPRYNQEPDGGVVKIKAGTGIAQIIFHRLDTPTDQPYGNSKYQEQSAGPQPAIFER